MFQRSVQTWPRGVKVSFVFSFKDRPLVDLTHLLDISLDSLTFMYSLTFSLESGQLSNSRNIIKLNISSRAVSLLFRKKKINWAWRIWWFFLFVVLFLLSNCLPSQLSHCTICNYFFAHRNDAFSKGEPKGHERGMYHMHILAFTSLNNLQKDKKRKMAW